MDETNQSPAERNLLPIKTKERRKDDDDDGEMRFMCNSRSPLKKKRKQGPSSRLFGGCESPRLAFIGQQTNKFGPRRCDQQMCLARRKTMVNAAVVVVVVF
jgi:hypothetical protein